MSSDRGKTWQEISGNLPRKYTEAIRADRSRSGVLIAGGEDGLWRSENSGDAWSRAGASGVSIMRIEQSPHDPCFWLAATERAGVFSSTDCGQTFENLGRVGVDRNTYDIAFDPGESQPHRLAIWGTGVVVSEDSGKTWQIRGRTLPSSEIWAVAFDPAKPGRLFASVHEEAIYVSEDAGVTWTRDGLEGSTVSRLKFLEEPADDPRDRCCSRSSSRAPAAKPSTQRRQSMIDFQANPKVLETAGYATIAAKLYNKQDPAWCSKRLQELLAAGPQGDMFWMYPVTAIAYLDKGQLTASARKALRESWKTYTPYRGDTENHWLLYYTTLYLMSQMYPDEPGDTWFTGKSSQENFEESKRWIESWVKLTTTRGQGEYDSTHYMGVYHAADVVSRRMGEGSCDEEAGDDDARLSHRAITRPRISTGSMRALMRAATIRRLSSARPPCRATSAGCCSA